jgi:hypothetical protein
MPKPPRGGSACWHRRTAWGVQRYRRRPQAAHSAGGPPPKRPKGRVGGRRAGPGETLGNPWPPLPIRPCAHTCAQAQTCTHVRSSLVIVVVIFAVVVTRLIEYQISPDHVSTNSTHLEFSIIGLRRAVFKGVEDGRGAGKPPLKRL